MSVRERIKLEKQIRDNLAAIEYQEFLERIENERLVKLLADLISLGVIGNTELNTAISNSLDSRINEVALSAYTLLADDNDGKTYLRLTSSSAVSVTIPSTQTKPISISQRGTGITTLVAGSGVTLNGTLAFTAQHQTKTVIPLGSGVYDVVG